MIEALESRELMSATLPTTDTTATDTQPTTAVVVDASATKVKVQEIHFTASVNKASPSLM
jgi:type VI protein secretion system component Hcp